MFERDGKVFAFSAAKTGIHSAVLSRASANLRHLRFKVPAYDLCGIGLSPLVHEDPARPVGEPYRVWFAAVSDDCRLEFLHALTGRVLLCKVTQKEGLRGVLGAERLAAIANFLRAPDTHPEQG